MMAVSMFGASMILLSRIIAKRWPTFSVVTWPKRCAPAPLRRNSTTGRLFCGSKPWAAWVSMAPSTETRFFTTR